MGGERSATTDPSRVRLEQVSRMRGRRRVLDEVDLDLRRGDLVGVVGANGSGKTTLLRVVVGLTRPSSGSVVRAPGVVAYVPEVFARPDRLSARSCLRHLGRIRGMSARAADTRSAELLDRLALAGGADTPMGRLSKGNAQKVVIAQALMAVPDLFVLDEPWSGLDAAIHQELGVLLREVAAAGGAVVLTDHDHAAVNAVATTVSEIVAGRLVAAVPIPTATAGPRDLMTVELLAPDEDGPLPWAGMPGVHREWRRGRTCTVQLGRGDHDRLLQVAIAQHWSITAVAAVDADGSGPSDQGDGWQR